jgi:hypothetical protein
MIAGIPQGTIIHPKSTADLRVGDMIHIEFPFFSAGRLVFGSEETFFVSRKDGDKIYFVDKEGQPPPHIPQPIGGKTAQLIAKLEEATSIDKVTIVRPVAKPAPVQKPPDEVPTYPQEPVGIPEAAEAGFASPVPLIAVILGIASVAIVGKILWDK